MILPIGFELYIKILHIHTNKLDDILKQESFDHIDTWSKHIDKLNPIAIKVLIGNKLDLIHDRKVSTEEAQKYAAMNNMDYYELSAKDDINVSECFLNIGRRIINEYEYILKQSYSDDNDINDVIDPIQTPHCHCVVL